MKTKLFLHFSTSLPTAEEKRLRAIRDLEKVGKKAIDSAQIQRKMREERRLQAEEKRNLRRQRMQMASIEGNQRGRSAQLPEGYS